jgi:shikimate dehydrogenase
VKIPAVRFGLIGYPLDHSASASYFTKKFTSEGLTNYSYQLFPLKAVEEVNSLLAVTSGLKGFNVTIPYKESIIPFLTVLHPDAEAIGAVNTVLVKTSGTGTRLIGYNTDAEGFRRSLPPTLSHRNALILGTGGSAKAVAFTLRKLGLNVLLVSRTERSQTTISYEELTRELMHQFTFIINCTPAGMFPDLKGTPPLPLKWLSPGHFVYDLIYNPEETLLLRNARKAGAVTKNGQLMFETQAELSFRIWSEQ